MPSQASPAGDMSASTSDPINEPRPNGPAEPTAENGAVGDQEVSEGDEPPPPPPVPQFSAAEAPVLVDAPTTDSVKVSWTEITQTGLSGIVPEGATFPDCGMEYGLELREVRIWNGCPG